MKIVFYLPVVLCFCIKIKYFYVCRKQKFGFCFFCLFQLKKKLSSISTNPFSINHLFVCFHFHFPCSLGVSISTIQNLSKHAQQVVEYKGYYYKKSIGRAYHSHWICIKSPCNGKIRITELKGGSISILHPHDKCEALPRLN